MKAAFLLSSISRASGGIFEISRRTAQTLADRERVSVSVLGIEDEFSNDDLSEWRPLQPRCFPAQGLSAYRFAPGLSSALKELNPDLVHVHGVWSYPTVAARKWSGRRQPFLVTIHGMLEPWALRNSRWKKVVAGLLFENAALRQAACLHVNSMAELASVRAYGLRNPVCIIPNGIDLPGQVAHEPPPWQSVVAPGQKVLLYLGRLHPKKGLCGLLSAWATLRARGFSGLKDWKLVLAGWDQVGHEAELKAQAVAQGLSDSVCFLGPQFGESKAAAYHHADAFVLPSHSEGLPMVVLEAWSHGLPVLMTPQCNLPEGFSSRAAISIGTDPKIIAEGIEHLMTMTDASRAEIGLRGRRLVCEGFQWSAVAAQTRSVYDWLTGAAPIPSCVSLN